MDEQDAKSGELQVNPGYALSQIAQAICTSEQHEDSATRERARERIAKWITVFQGLVKGELKVGSRTPLDGIPAWVTTEVVTGGFVTGKLLADGPLLEHERALLNSRKDSSAESDARRNLNRYYISEAGFAELQDRLRTGCYDVGVPEEGALLVVAWLAERGHTEAARELLDCIGPFFSRLRFYPIPADSPTDYGSHVFVQTVGEVLKSLRQRRPNPRILAQREAIQVWTPLYDRTVRAFLETVEGAPPRLRFDADGHWPADGNRRFAVEGGWPCQRYPEGWKSRAQSLLEEIHDHRKSHQLTRKPDHRRSSFAQLRQFLSQCVAEPLSLSGKEVGRIRLILARYITKHGLPDEASRRRLREEQARQAAIPAFHELSSVVISRLEGLHLTEGIDDVDPIVKPISERESQEWHVASGTKIPDTFRRKIERCLCAAIEVLLGRGIIPSAESLARVLPQMTSDIGAAGIVEPSLRRLYAAIYRAFRRRRSLLLVNLQRQVQIEELPWIAAVSRFRGDARSSQATARRALEEVTVLAITSFPHTILPNKLLQELRALAKGAELNLPIVDELAADIFMGRLSATFLKASKQAAELLTGTLYAAYYGIDFEAIRRIPEVAMNQDPLARTYAPDPLVELYAQMAGVPLQSHDTAQNGMIIEQQQIITTQNLAVLFKGLNLQGPLQGRLNSLAQQCLIWILRRLQVKSERQHARLIMLKNTAYAWRQMTFFLSLTPPDELQEFFRWAEIQLNEQREEFRTRFGPAMRGLVRAAGGQSSQDEFAANHQARRFLGWSNKPHWLIN